MATNEQNVAYMRVSSYDQPPEPQLPDMHFDRIYEEKASTKDTARPVLTDCIKQLTAGDTLHVHSIDRLARNLNHLQEIVANLTDKGVAVQFHKESLIFTGKDDPAQNLMRQMISAVAQFERALIKERQREGIAEAQIKGTRFGAKKKLSDKQVSEIKKRVAQREPITALAREYGVARQTIYTVLQSELKSRFHKVKTIAMLEGRESMGSVELVNWWKNFIGKIPANATFDDLDSDTQALLIKWEEKLDRELK